MNKIIDSILDYIKNICVDLCKILFFFVPVKKNRIVFVRKFYSGSNVTPVYKMIKKKYPKLDVEIIDNNSDNMTVLKLFDLYKKLFTAKLIVTTHGSKLKTKKNITLDLWHGIPLKGMNFMNNSAHKAKPLRGVDYFASYSSFCNTLFNACFGLNINQYRIFGSPRNDYLLNKSSKKAKKFIHKENGYKYVFYLPTFRNYYIKNYNNFIKNLCFNSFDLVSFNNFLVKNKIKFIIKPHPAVCVIWEKILKEIKLPNIILIYEKDLNKGDIDFYEILSLSDILVTDYSSVYFDYLLLDKPIIFISANIERYRRSNGLLLEPYEFWTPGPKCITQQKLETEIIKSINKKDYYKKERKAMTDIFHKYKDVKSTERVVDFITSLLKQK